MTKLYYNTNGMNSVILPSITRTISNLNDAASRLSRCSVPYESNVSLWYMSSEIQSIQSSLNNLKCWCEDSNNTFNNKEDAFENDIRMLSNAIIPLRNKRIKE